MIYWWWWWESHTAGRSFMMAKAKVENLILNTFLQPAAAAWWCYLLISLVIKRLGFLDVVAGWTLGLLTPKPILESGRMHWPHSLCVTLDLVWIYSETRWLWPIEVWFLCVTHFSFRLLHSFPRSHFYREWSSSRISACATAQVEHFLGAGIYSLNKCCRKELPWPPKRPRAKHSGSLGRKIPEMNGSLNESLLFLFTESLHNPRLFLVRTTNHLQSGVWKLCWQS